MRLLQGWGLAALVIASVGCKSSSDAEVVLDLLTDYVAGAEFERVRVRVEEEPTLEQGFLPSDRFETAHRLGSLVRPARTSHRVSVALLRDDGSVLAEDTRRLTFAPGTVGVTFVMSRNCAGVMCAANETCIGGRCLPDDCIRGDEDGCVPDCTSDEGCPDPPASCARGVCTFGSCLVAESAECSAAEYCDPVAGCTPLPGELDAGTDAGTDAGECASDPDCLPGAGECHVARCVDAACVYTDDDAACAGTRLCRGGACGPRYDCTPAADDDDGDGIPNNRDPWPARCNATYSDQDLPARDPAWIPTRGTDTADGIAIAAGGQILHEAFPQPRHYFEARFTLGAIMDPDQWSIGLWHFGSDGEHQVCQLYFNEMVDMTFPGMGPRVRIGGTLGGDDCCWFPDVPIAAAPGETYVLQYWTVDAPDGEYGVCQLANDAGPIGMATTDWAATHPPQPVGVDRLRVVASRRDATFHHILVTER